MEVALILGNGIWKGKKHLLELIDICELIVAVDGGWKKAVKAGIAPHVVIGDLDSLSPQEKEKLEQSEVELILHPSEKDKTDMELALDYVVGLKKKKVIMFGVLGGRTDHTLANLFLLFKGIKEDLEIKIINGQEEIYLLKKEIEIKGKSGDIISLIPATEVVEGIFTSGLQYPLNGESLYSGSSRGISNVMLSSKARISASSGILWVFHLRR